jgi:hypothetical protein
VHAKAGTGGSFSSWSLQQAIGLGSLISCLNMNFNLS